MRCKGPNHVGETSFTLSSEPVNPFVVVPPNTAKENDTIGKTFHTCSKEEVDSIASVRVGGAS